MKYDKDLKRVRFCIWVAITISGFLAGAMVYLRNWWVVIAFVSWILNMFVWLDVIRCQQIGRDHARIIEAELNDVIGSGWKD